MLSSFSSRCFSFCSSISLANEAGHGIERWSQRRHLIAAAKLYPVAQVALVHVFGGAIEFCYRSGHAAREANTNVEGNKLNHRKENSNQEQASRTIR